MWRDELRKVQVLADPVSSVTVPLLYGLGRRRLLRGGATQHEVRLNGMTIHYYREGPHDERWRQGGRHDRPLPIVLVHGIADNALTWSLVMGPLARDYEVYAVDLPGYGLSGTPAGRGFATIEEMRDVLAELTRTAIGRPALIVGNSMGGWLAVRLAWAAPELVRGIVLLDAGGAPLEGRASWESFAET